MRSLLIRLSEHCSEDSHDKGHHICVEDVKIIRRMDLYGKRKRQGDWIKWEQFELRWRPKAKQDMKTCPSNTKNKTIIYGKLTYLDKGSYY